MKVNAIRVRFGMVVAALAAISALNFGAVIMTSAPRPLASQGAAYLETTGSYNGLTAANRINDALDALLTCNKGGSAPTNALGEAAKAGQCWLDDSNALMLVKKRYSGAAWVVEGVIDVANGVWSPPIGGGAGSVASASTTDLCAAPAAFQTVTGTATIAGFGSNCPAGTKKVVLFQGIATITYNAGAMILPGQRDFTSAAGDVIEAVSLGGGNWRVTSITKIDGNAVLSPSFRVGTMYYTFEDIDSKAVLAFGQALSRASYPDFFSAVTRTQSAVRSSGNNTLTSVANTKGLGAGMPIEGNGIQPGTTISSVTASTIVMSANASSSGTSNVTVFKTGYGAGGDSTTVGVPNCEGKKIAGRSDMSGTDSATLSGATALNSTLGNKTSTLLTANLPPYTPSGSIVTAFGGKSVPLFGSPAVSSVNSSGGINGPYDLGGPSGISFAASATSTFTGTAQGGTSTPLAIVDPTLIADCAIRVLP